MDTESLLGCLSDQYSSPLTQQGRHGDGLAPETHDVAACYFFSPYPKKKRFSFPKRKLPFGEITLTVPCLLAGIDGVCVGGLNSLSSFSQQPQASSAGTQIYSVQGHTSPRPETKCGVHD